MNPPRRLLDQLPLTVEEALLTADFVLRGRHRQQARKCGRNIFYTWR